MAVKQGYIKDNENNQPLAGCNVIVYDINGNQVAATTTNADGFFTVEGYENEVITVSHIGYKPVNIFLDGFNESFAVSMVKNEIDLPPVVVKASGKGYLWLLALLPLFLIKDQQKAVSGTGITTATVVTVGIGILFLKGFGILNSILEGLGLQKSKEDVIFEEEQANPYSAFNPNFWKYAQEQGHEVLILTVAGYAKLRDQLISAFGYLDDDEQVAIGVFTSMRTKSQVSFFAYMWQQEGRGDLLQYLRGGAWPQDRLSTEEVNQIINYVNKLPNYTA